MSVFRIFIKPDIRFSWAKLVLTKSSSVARQAKKLTVYIEISLLLCGVKS